MRNRTPSDRAQSEVMGFVLVFAVVVTAIALIAATGFAGLTNAQEVEHANNAVRAMDILAENVDDLVRGRAPHRGTELKLSGSQLALGDTSTVTVSGRHTTDSTRSFTYAVDVRPIEYVVGADTTMVYAGGAVIRQEADGGMFMVRDPSFVLGTDEVVLPIVQTRSLDGTAVGGDRTVNVRTTLAETELLVAETGPYDVTYSVTSDRADAWEAYFTEHPATDVTRSGDTVTATIRTERVYVTIVRVDVAFE